MPVAGAFEWVDRPDLRVAAVVRNSGLSRDIWFMAENMRDQMTGTHAHVIVAYGNPQGGGRFDWIEDDTFNIGRMKERNALANAAADIIVTRHNAEVPNEQRFPPINSTEGKPFLRTVRRWMNEFCGQAWDQYVGHFDVEERAGSAEPQGPQWLMRPWSLKNSSTILFGREGGGKSNVMIIWALMVMYGISNDLGQVEEQMPVLFVNLERAQDQVDDQVGNIAEAMGLPRETMLPRIDARGHSLRDVAPAIQKFVEKHDRKCVVALDSISRGIVGDLNANDAANELVNRMNAFGCPWWAIAHEAKDPERKRKERTIFGAGAFAWAADLTVALDFEDRGLYEKEITLQTGKVNNAPRSGRQAFRLHFEADHGLVRFGRSDTTPVLLGKSPELGTRDRIVVHLKRTGKQTYKQLCAALDIDERTIRRVLKDDYIVKRSSSQPIEFYISERGNSGQRILSEVGSVPMSEPTPDPGDADVIGGTFGHGGGPLKGPSTPKDPEMDPELPVTVAEAVKPSPDIGSGSSRDPDPDPMSDVVYKEACFHCKKKKPPERYRGDGKPVCLECAERLTKEGRPYA